MFERSDGDSAMRFTFSSEMQFAEEAILDSSRLFNDLEVEQSVGIKVVMHELLKNAIQHGNRGNRALQVICEIERLGVQEFRITVRDEGDGFDFNSLDFRLPEDPRFVRRRGYLIVNSIAERLEFNRKGNQVTAHLLLPNGSGHSTNSTVDPVSSRIQG